MADPLHPPGEAPPPETPLDAGSRALSEALRSSFTIVKVVMGLLVLVFLASGFFIVEQQERVIVLRFGRAVGRGQAALLGPGLHWSFPYPIDERVRVSITGRQQVKSTVGWYFTTPAQERAHIEPPAGPTLNPAVDGYVLTADDNIIHSRALLTYHISDPIRYVFDFQNASNTVKNLLDNALLYAAGHFPVDDILTHNGLGFRDAVLARVADIARVQDLGLVVDQCDVESVYPRQCKEAFEKVIKADVSRNTALSGARSEAIRVVSTASAAAFSRTNAAVSEALRLVNDASRDADRLQKLLPLYQQNPSLLGLRQLETLSTIFTNAEYKILVTDNPDGKQQLWLQFSKPQIEAPK